MKILILLNQPYPNGYALTKRIHLYANGINANGQNAIIIIPNPREKFGESKNNQTKGIYDGVQFEYASQSCERSNFFIIRRLQDFAGYINSGIVILKHRPDIIITTKFSTLYFIFIKLIALCISAKFVIEKCEVDYLNKDKISKFEKTKIRVIHQLFNGIIVISNQLEKYHRTELKLKVPLINIPILIENQFYKKPVAYTKTIVYTGTYLERKDGILTILKAFAEFAIDFQDYKLVLTGSAEGSPDYPEIISIINNEKINGKIIFTGYLLEEALHDIIKSAALLIIAKPINRQNNYNFPTKIGEYMISGRPILSTNVGIVGDILTDNVNIFFEDFNPHKFASKMKSIIQNKTHATKVGENGREYAIQNFNHIIHTEKLINYFKSI